MNLICMKINTWVKFFTRIWRYPPDKSVANKTNYAIQWMMILNPVDSVIHHLNYWAQQRNNILLGYLKKNVKCTSKRLTNVVSDSCFFGHILQNIFLNENFKTNCEPWIALCFVLWFSQSLFQTPLHDSSF